jgi:hypothetical protein
VLNAAHSNNDKDGFVLFSEFFVWEFFGAACIPLKTEAILSPAL